MLQDLITELNKKFGSDTVITGKLPVRGVIPTGSIGLDQAIGVGGYPIGKISEIFGAESSGKSTLCIHAAIMAQLSGRGCIYIDAENSFDPAYADSLGLDRTTDKFILIQPNTAEQALEIVEHVIQNDDVGLVILDSVAGMVPSKESYGEGEIGDVHVGIVARLMTQFVRRITPLLKNKTNAALIMVNQVRDNIGGGPYSSLQTPGGRALKHGMAVRIKVGRKSTIKDTDNMGINVIAQVVKNKVAVPYSSAEFIIRMGKGIDVSAEVTKLLVENKLIKKTGSWYKDADGNTLGQGSSSVDDWINEHADVVEKLLIENGVSPLYVKRFN